MTYYGQIPKTPDVREDRWRYFNRGQTDFPKDFAMPQGQEQYDVGDPSSELPDLWPEIQQELRGIMQQNKQPYYMTPEGGELTPEQIESNKMLMAWKSPAGLSAIETGKYRESAEKEKGIDRAENRVAAYGKQLAAAHKAEAPKGLVMQLEKSYNAAVSNLDKLLGEGQESGHGKYTGKGKFELAGMAKEPGMFSRAAGAVKDWVVGDSQGGPGVLRGQESPLGPGQPDEMQPGQEFGVGDATQQAGKVFIRGLLKMDKIFADIFGNEKAKTLTDQIVKGTKDPAERLQAALSSLPAKAQKNPEVQELQRQLTAQKVQAMPAPSPMQDPGGMPPTEQPQESMPILQRFQQGLPSNEEYIQGGGLPGMIGRGIQGKPLVQRGE